MMYDLILCLSSWKFSSLAVTKNAIADFDMLFTITGYIHFFYVLNFKRFQPDKFSEKKKLGRYLKCLKENKKRRRSRQEDFKGKIMHKYKLLFSFW